MLARGPEKAGNGGEGSASTLQEQLTACKARLRAASCGSRSTPRHFTLSEARSRLYRRRSLQVNSHFAAFFKIYKIFTILRRSNLKISQSFVKNLVILKESLQNLYIFKIKQKNEKC